MNTLTMKKSTETYLEQNTIELHYHNVMDGETVVGKMKADYKTITQRTFSGYVVVNGVETSVKNQTSMKNVLALLNEVWSNSVVEVNHDAVSQTTNSIA